MVRGVIYDLDGTLVDSRGDLADSVNAMLARMGLPVRPDEVIHGFIGEGAERLIRRSLGPNEGRYLEAAPIWREEYAKRLLARTRLYDGIEQVLQAPPEARAVLTNKPGAFARQILQGLGVERAFLAVRGGDEGPRKPAPDGLLELCQKLEVRPKDALLVGDSAVDLATGKAAGVRVCAVRWGLGDAAALSSADYTCATPRELCALLARLVNAGSAGGSHGPDPVGAARRGT
ncbi:MAG TPA: HAD-IA family hydrolase [Myxococcales bacterium]|nr:HAD-IA family hydrolase [Myxococcales bacterium]